METSTNRRRQGGAGTGMPLFDRMNQVGGFEKYDADHPLIWKAFVEITLSLIHDGVKHGGAKAIFETIRTHWATDASEFEFKIDNTFTGDYARKFHRVYPLHDGFFEIRERKNV